MNILYKTLFLYLYSTSLLFSQNNIVKVDFLSSLLKNKFAPKDFKNIYNRNGNWQKLEQLYNCHFKNKNYTRQALIPPLIHQIWLGDKPLPEEHKQFRISWQKKHPHWKYKLWRDEDAKKFPLINREAFEKAKNYGEKSDILRYEILYQQGGIYADDDFECLEPFGQIHIYCEFYAGAIIDKLNEPALLNGIIGSMPGHPILKKCIEFIQYSSVTANNYSAILERTGPKLLTKAFFSVIDSLKNRPIVIFPPTYFYALPYQARCNNLAEVTKWIQPESLALHYWALSWNNGKIG